MKAVRLAQQVELWTVNRATQVRFPGGADYSFVVTDQENLYTAIRTVPLLWYVPKFQFLAEVKTTCTGKLLDSLPRNNAVAEMCSDKFNVAYRRDP
jgi:hypothetical protein